MPAKKKAPESEIAANLKESLGLLTLEEVAEAFSLKLYTVQRLVREKVIKSIHHTGSTKMPRNLRVRRQELERYIASLDAPPAPAEVAPPTHPPPTGGRSGRG